MDDLLSNINEAFRIIDIPIELKSLNKPDVELLLQDKIKRETLIDSYRNKNDTIETLESFHLFLINQKRYMPSLNPEIKTILNQLLKEHGKVLKLIEETNKSLKNLFSAV